MTKPRKPLATNVEYGFDINTNEYIIKSIEQVKEYKLDLFQFRNNIISTIKNNKIALPHYHITLTYYNNIKNRDIITKNHRFIRNNIEECLNTRYRNHSDKSSLFFFCERHKSYLSSSEGNRYYLFNQVKTNNMVKNTIIQTEEYDKVDSEVVEGAYHSHILKSEIPDDIIFNANGKTKKLIKEVLGYETINQNIDKTAKQNIKIALLKAICRRSDIVGNSKASIQIKTANPKYYYNDYIGWEGYIAYATKKCYNSYMMMDVIDEANSSFSIFPNRQPILETQKKSIYKEENE